MTRDKSFFVNPANKRDKSFFVKEEKPAEISNSMIKKTPQIDSTQKTNMENRIAELDNLMKETDLKIRQHAKYTVAERDEFLTQYNNYKSEYWKLKNELKTQNTPVLPKEKSKYVPEDAQVTFYTPEQMQEINKQAPLSQKIDKAVKHDIPVALEKAGRTAVDIYASGAAGVGSAVEGITDFAVGNVGNIAAGVTSGFGLAPNRVSNAIKRGTENFVKKDLGLQELVDEVKNEGAGAYEPKVLGVKVRDISNNIANMITAGSLGGVYGFIGSAGGRGIQEALNEGQGLNRATIYGDISGVVEGLTEKLFDSVKIVGGGKLDKFLPKSAIGKLVGGAAGEGIEEMISEGLNPVLKGMTYEQGTYEAPTIKEWAKNVGQAAWQGFVVGLLLKGGQDISDSAVREQYKNEVSSAVDKVKGLTQQQKEIVKQELSNASEQASAPLLALPAGNENMAYANNGNIELGDGINSETIQQNVNYDVVNGRQVLAMPKNTDIVNPLPTQKAQETLQSAKLVGMTDVDIKKATELNNMLQSGAKLKFYDANNIPEGVGAKAAGANGFYLNGTLWINKNSQRQVEKILGHELTHHLENTKVYNDFANEILDSNIFYDYITSQGYDNVAQFKENLRQRGYNDQEMDSEMVSMFVEDNLFDSQEKIDRLARENRTIAQKILNWLSDLKTKLAGTSQEKELLRIENMYRKALEQSRNVDTTSTDAQYSFAGTKAMKNINDAELINAYNEAVQMKNNKADNEIIRRKTGWFQDKNGAWKFEFSDKDMKIKDDIQIIRDKTYKLDYLLEHDVLFTAYPKLRNYKIEFTKLREGVDGNHIGLTNTIQIDPDKVSSKEEVEGIIIHELQHVIQKIEGFERGASSKKSKLAYYTSLGEIEAADTRRRLEMEREGKLDRREVAPESSKANPKHEGLDDYLSKRTEKDIEKDNKFLEQKARKGGGINEESMGFKNNKLSTHQAEQTTGLAGDVRRLAGKEPAFSLPENDNQGRKLSPEQQEFFKDSKVRDEEDRLIPVYHGSANEFTIFDKNKIKTGATLYANAGDGFYFTDNEAVADKYSKDKFKYTTYLNITNPLVVENNLTNEAKQILKEFSKQVIEKHPEKTQKKMFAYEEFDENVGEQSGTSILSGVVSEYGNEFTEFLKSKGYDGIKSSVSDYAGLGEKYNYVAFEPNQIKNVDNTNPTENPDIRYSVNPVDIAKNPPNIETGLDQLNRAKRVKEGDSQSSFAGNILNQSIFDEKFTNLALDDKNIRNYESISNKETLQEANDSINEQGQKWVDRFLNKPNGEMRATDIAGGFILMNRYQQAGDYESMIRIAEKLRKAGTQQGQTIQMFSVLGRMTPEGMTYYAQKTLSDAYDEILKNKTQKWADEHADEFKLNERDIEFIQRRVNQAAKLPEGRDKYVLLGEIAERIQNKIPPQPGQSIKALARNSMLLNPKTMVRNVLGNVVIVPNHIISDFIGAGIDKAISKKTGVRTTGVTNAKDMLKGAKKGFYESFDDFRRGISTREVAGDRFEIGQGKNFNKNHTGALATPRNAINKALNGLDRVTGYLLETGDRPFYESWFINSLNNQMKLNNVEKPTAEMIEIATDEALQRTWQDNNTYTRVVSSVRNGLNKFNIKGYGLGDMVMPFVKTPANLTKAVVEFSPLGAINAAIKTSQFNKDIGKGMATSKQQREVVKAWSQVITGSLGMAIMSALADAGILTGGSDEDKDVRGFEQNILGIKPYSIKIGDKTYTYDWAQPLGTSAAIVADMKKSIKNADDTEGKVGAVLKGLQSGTSVLLDQSFVSGIRNLFEEDNLINALIETGFNEGAKFTPQFMSQIAQIQDDTARTSYVYNNIPKTALNKVKAKIPGLRQTLEPSVDVLGREVKTDNSVGNVMFNPANTAFARSTKGAEEMYRVYQATGDKATIAQVAPYYFNVGNDKIVLTPKQRTQYQKTTGKIASDGVENLLNNKAYKKLEDTDKAEILKELYSYGNAIAKEEASTSYLLPSAMKKIKESDLSPEEYILLKYISNSSGSKKDEMYNALIQTGYSKKQVEEFLTDYKGYKFESTTKNTLPTLAQQRAKLPSLKK